MISVQYIPLSIRVRAWNLSLFSQSELESFIDEEMSIIMTKVTAKEKNHNIDVSSYKNFALSLQGVELDYLKIAVSASSGSSKSFIKELFHEFEIHNLKNVVRMLISGKFQDIFYPYVFTESLTIKKISDVRTFNELMQILDNTPYAIFKKVVEQVEQEKNALYWELALDNYFVSRINNISRRMDMDSKLAIKRLLILPIQQDRLISLYRYRFHYNVEPAEVLRYVPNLTTLMTLEVWNKFVFAPSNLDFYHQLIEIGYITDNVPNHASGLKIAFQQQLEKNCRNFMHKDLTSIASFLAFIQFKKIQFKKIITILEAKSLQVSKADIMQFL